MKLELKPLSEDLQSILKTFNDPAASMMKEIIARQEAIVNHINASDGIDRLNDALLLIAQNLQTFNDRQHMANM